MQSAETKRIRNFREPPLEGDTRPQDLLSSIVKRLVTIATECGVDPKVLATTMKQEADRQIAVRKVQRPRSRSRIPNDLLSRIIQRWHLDPDYLDPMGFPCLLVECGRKSLQSLLKTIGSNEAPTLVWTELVRSGVVAVDRSKRLRVLTRMLIGPRERQVTTGLNTIMDAASTVEHNLTVRDTRLVFCHRVVTDSFVPKSRLLEFSAILERQANSALGSIDEWCNNARLSAQRSEKLIPVRVHFFLSPGESQDYSNEIRRLARGKRRADLRPAAPHRVLESYAISFVPGMPPRTAKSDIVAKFSKSDRVR